MNYKKENLIKLLKLVEEISSAPGNDWFLESLKNKFSFKLTPIISNTHSIDAKISQILSYLSINMSRLIDYSKFEEPVKESLIRDCIEMVRYENGTPNHKINFGEFCRYAHLQAEEMINYFLNKLYNKDIDSICNFIQNNTQNYRPNKKPTEVHHIYYTQKIAAFKSVYTLSPKASDCFWFLNEFRNELSHRSSLSNTSENTDLALFESSGFRGKTINVLLLDDQQRKIYNRGKFIITKRMKDFNSIYDSLEELKSKVIDSLNTSKQQPINKSTFGGANSILNEIKKKLDEAK